MRCSSLPLPGETMASGNSNSNHNTPSPGASPTSSGRNSTVDRPRSPGSPTSPTTPGRPPGHQHRPSQPSQLRQLYMPGSSPEDQRMAPELERDGIHPQDHAPDAVTSTSAQQGTIDEPEGASNEATALLSRYNQSEGEGHDHNTSVGRPRHGRAYGSFGSYAETTGSFERHRKRNRPSLGGRIDTSDDVNRQSNAGLLRNVPDAITDGLLGKAKRTGTTHWLAKRAGINSERLMCVCLVRQAITHRDEEILRSLISLALFVCLASFINYTNGEVGTSNTMFPSPSGPDNTNGVF